MRLCPRITGQAFASHMNGARSRYEAPEDCATAFSRWIPASDSDGVRGKSQTDSVVRWADKQVGTSAGGLGAGPRMRTLAPVALSFLIMVAIPDSQDLSYGRKWYASE